MRYEEEKKLAGSSKEPLRDSASLVAVPPHDVTVSLLRLHARCSSCLRIAPSARYCVRVRYLLAVVVALEGFAFCPAVSARQGRGPVARASRGHRTPTHAASADKQPYCAVQSIAHALATGLRVHDRRLSRRARRIVRRLDRRPPVSAVPVVRPRWARSTRPLAVASSGADYPLGKLARRVRGRPASDDSERWSFRLRLIERVDGALGPALLRMWGLLIDTESGASLAKAMFALRSGATVWLRLWPSAERYVLVQIGCSG